ncbi:PHB depolymerase family esterase [Amanita muscaria]
MKTSIPLALFVALTSFDIVSSLPTVPGVTPGTTIEFTHNGTAVSRDYNVYTPSGYTTTSSVPLVLVLHGCYETPTNIPADSRFDALADKEQFIVAYPSQSLSANPFRCWNWFLPDNQARGSGEGMFDFCILTCCLVGVTYPDVFAAIGVGSGFQYESATTFANALAQIVGPGPDPVQQGRIAYQAMSSYARRVPTITFHGTDDNIVPEIHGKEVTISMAVANSLADPSFTNTDFNTPSSNVTMKVPVPDGYTYSAASWNDIIGKPVIQLYQIYDMNHAWSRRPVGLHRWLMVQVCLVIDFIAMLVLIRHKTYSPTPVVQVLPTSHTDSFWTIHWQGVPTST